ncbi:uncharacterized protein [Ptychodera flava]|uniref:uncharacterized protein n=1 Tax=Ptychodera flava TaxID=63121 RepID=UPI00396A3C01
MFELNKLHKGYFPHFFNTAENQDYVGPLPDSRYYAPDGMKQHAREKFLKWYEDERLKNHPFNLRQELEDYCKSDVDILRRSCLKFQDLFKQQNGVDPFKDSVTITSACNVVLRKNFIKKIPLGSFQTMVTSIEEINLSLDCSGYNGLHSRTMSTSNTSTMEEPLHPQDAFFGGRTNATTLYNECVDDEEIHYVDITSLHPYVHKYCKYPIKHPKVRTKNIVLPVQLYLGLVKCRVLPPRNLYFPVLPLRVEKKLMFPLCRICADTKQQSPCEHNDEQRSFVGTWTTPELAKAVEKGYKIVKVFEVWHYREREVYNRESHTGGLFTDYINTFLKLKQESSGWPSWCQTEDDQDRYIREYYDREGILLDKTKIHRNPGQRALAKLMLNSMWGKFAQCNNFPQLQYIKEPVELFCLLTRAVNTNVVIAAFTTAYARLKLYDLLESIGEQVLYYDTDSVIFVSNPDQYEPHLGDYLGDLTNELDPPSNFITKFVSGGAKNYAFCLAQPNRKCNTTLCKVRESP